MKKKKYGDIRDTWKPGDEVPPGYYVDKLFGQLCPERSFTKTKKGGTGHAMQIIRDIEPYRSMVDGSVVGGRKQHRDHLKAHGCIEVGNEKLTEKRAELSDPKQDIRRAVQSELPREVREQLSRAQYALRN